MDAKTKKQLRRLVTEFQRYSQQMAASGARTEDQRLRHIWEGRGDTAAWAAERLNALIPADAANPRQNANV